MHIRPHFLCVGALLLGFCSSVCVYVCVCLCVSVCYCNTEYHQTNFFYRQGDQCLHIFTKKNRRQTITRNTAMKLLQIVSKALVDLLRAYKFRKCNSLFVSI